MLLKIDNVLDKSIVLFSLLALVCLPFDSLPNLFSTIYRPLSLIFIMLASPLVMMRYIINYHGSFLVVFFKKHFILLLFFVVTVPFSYFSTYSFGFPFEGSHDYTLSLLLGMATYFVLTESFDIIQEQLKSNHSFIELIITWLAIIYIPVLFIGIVEMLIMIGILSIDVKMMLIGWAVPYVHDRIQLFSGEPSWASMHLIFIIPIYLHQVRISKLYIIPLIISVELILFSFSMQGILTLIIAIFTLFVIYIKKIKTVYFIIIIGIIISLALVWLFISHQYADSYFVTRIYDSFEINHIFDIIYLDGSFFVRLIYPTLAIMMGFNYPILGIGGGNFRYMFSDVLPRYFSRGFQFREVVYNYSTNTSNPKNLLARLFGETGILGTMIFSFFLYTVLIKIKTIKSELRPFLVIWVVFVFANMMQFDSFAYMHLWVVLSVIYSLKQEHENEKYID